MIKIHSDGKTLSKYAHDYGVQSIKPRGVVFPKSTKDVIEIVNYCSKYNIPLTCRGGGSSLIGQCLGKGIIVDFSKYMNKILRMEKNAVVVQPGIVLDQLNKRLKSMQFAPDPASAKLCTIGGMINTNASGPRAVFYGDTLDHIIELEVVLADGSVINTRKNSSPKNSNVKFVYDIAIKANGSSMKFNNVGYRLDRVRRNGFNENAVFAGSEGTLGIITKAKLRIVPKISTQLLLTYCHSLHQAVLIAQKTKKGKPLAVEFFDSTTHQFLFPALYESHKDDYLVCFEYPKNQNIKDTISLLSNHFTIIKQRGIAAFWYKRAKTTYSFESLYPGKISVPIIEDTCVPLNNFVKYYTQVIKVLNHHNIPYISFGHLAKGLIHIKPFFNCKKESKTIHLVKKKVYFLSKKYHASMSGEHGDGRVRKEFIHLTYPNLYPLFVSLKKYFDPKNVLNPGLKVN